jgi:hypothetical protein
MVPEAAEPCAETSPRDWREVSCPRSSVPSGYRCFLCVDDLTPERNRRVLQAFEPSCRRGVVLKACNTTLPGT